MNPIDPVPAKGRAVLLLLSDRQPSTSHSAHHLATLSPGPTLSLSCRCTTLGSRTELNPSSARPAYRLFLAAATPARIITTTQPDYSSCPIPHKATSLVTTPIVLSTRYTHAKRLTSTPSSTRSYPSIAQHVTRTLISFIRPSYPRPSPPSTVDRRLSLLHGPRSVPDLLCSAPLQSSSDTISDTRDPSWTAGTRPRPHRPNPCPIRSPYPPCLFAMARSRRPSRLP